jgi:hypothetical protein
MKITPKKVLRAAWAATKFAVNAALFRPVFVSPAEYSLRLTSCWFCDRFVYPDECGVCGCYVTKKARLATEACPHPTSPRWNAHKFL